MGRIVFLLGLIFFLFNNYSVCQEQEKQGCVQVDMNTVKETIHVFTDRSYYAVGEEIYFSASYYANHLSSSSKAEWSKILYFELIDSIGNSFIQKKFQLNHNLAVGKLMIDDQIPSGNYWLKVYTKWMRNNGVENYTYCPLVIVNPENLNGSKFFEISDEDSKSELGGSIDVKLSKENYGKREEVMLVFQNKLANSRDYTYALSVVDKGANVIQPTRMGVSNNEKSELAVVPDIYNISISGKVVDENTKEPQADAVVYLSTIAKQSYFTTVKTNCNGEFVLTLPEPPAQCEYYIHAIKDGIDLQVQIDNGYCTQPVSLHHSKQLLGDEELNLLKELMINAQLTQKFAKTSPEIPIKSDSIPKFFYGRPDKIYTTEKYIDLPDVKDFLFELVPEFAIKRKKKKNYIKLNEITTWGDLPVLTMVDNIPIFDHEEVLNISLQKVKQIEIISTAYVAGASKFNSVINVITKKNDYAGIKLPDNSVFFNYELAEIKKAKGSQKAPNSFSKRIPDRRNTLYWNANFDMNQEDGTVKFMTSDMPGKYEVVLQAFSHQTGEVFHVIKDFEVVAD